MLLDVKLVFSINLIFDFPRYTANYQPLSYLVMVTNHGNDGSYPKANPVISSTILGLSHSLCFCVS